MYRSVLMLVSASAALVVLSLAASAAASPPNRCLVVNTRADVAHRTLGEAVDAASTGDALRVRGTCAGGTDITGKDLRITGKSNPGWGEATLEGDATEAVLTLEDATVFISDLTITGGESGIATRFPSAVTVTRSRITGNGDGIGGFGHITVSESAVANNTGVGLSSMNPIDVTHATISQNAAGIIAFSTLTVRSSVVSGNTSIGGVQVVLGSATITSSVVSGNSTGFHGGGIFNSGSLTITDSVVSGNIAAGNGGGIYNWPGIPGDPFFIPARLTLSGTAVTGNTATSGGGIYAETPITLLGSNNVLCPNTPNDPPAPCS